MLSFFLFQSIKFKSGGEICSLINKERGEIMKGKKIVEVGLAAIIALSGVASAAAPAFAAPNVIYPNVHKGFRHIYIAKEKPFTCGFK